MRYSELYEAKSTSAERFIQKIEDRLDGISVSFEASDDFDVSIQRFHVPEYNRGQGIASRALKEIIKLADRMGITVYLEALPDDDDNNISLDDLVSFYKKFGFVEDYSSDGGVMMYRSPKRKAPIAESELPMDTKSRMARAKKMGFTIRAYHGTQHDINEFSLEKTKSNSSSGHAFNFADISDEASGYATRNDKIEYGMNVIPVLIRMRKPFIIDRDNYTVLNRMEHEKSKKHTIELIGYNPDEAERLGVTPKYNNWEDYGKAQEAAFEVVYNDNNRKQRWNEIYDDLKKQGYDGIIFKDVPTDFSEKHDYYKKIIVFDAKNVRSIFAKFDPTKSESGNLSEALRKPSEVTNFKNIYSTDDINTDVDLQSANNSPEWEMSLTDAMSKHGFKMIGNGINGAVYQSENHPYVVKIYRNDVGYDKWVAFCRSNKGNPYLPVFRSAPVRINKIFKAVRIEPLQSCSGFYKNGSSLVNHFFDRYYRELARVEEGKDYLYDKHLHDIAVFLHPHTGKNTDLTVHNLMCRQDLQVVIIDPLYYAVETNQPIPYDDFVL